MSYKGRTAPLDALYDHVTSLADWARKWPEVTSLDQQFDHQVYICWNGEEPVSEIAYGFLRLQQVIETAHRINIATARATEDGWKRKNIFSIGRSLRGGYVVTDQLNPTTASISQSREWKRILECIGANRMILLFTQYSIFYALENKCFHQLAGVGAQNVPARSSNEVIKSAPVDIRFDRGSLYYRQRRDAHILGWPHDHDFCTLMRDANVLEDMATAILRKIHANRDHGHANPSGPSPAGPKIPKTLKQRALPLVREMLERAQALNVRECLVAICPSRMPRHALNDEEKRAIVHLATQEPYAAQATEGATQAATRFEITQKKDHQPCFLDFACDVYQVVGFVQNIVIRLVPTELIGSKSNWSHLLRFVDIFVRAKRLDIVTLQSLVDGFRVVDCVWLFPPARNGQRARVSAEDAQQRTQYAQNMLFFLVDGILMPLLRFNFFITESSATRNQLHFFRSDDWANICQPVLEELKVHLYEKVLPGTTGCDTLGNSVIRLLPKERGMRPIANLGHRAPIHNTTRKQPSINDKLSDARIILSFEQKKQTDILGASLYTPDAILAPLLRLKDEIRPQIGQMPLFFVKVDIRACFDTLAQDRLLAVMRELIDHDAQYTLSRRAELSLRNGFLFRQYNAKSVLDQDAEMLFTDQVQELASERSRKIFVDHANTVTVSGQELHNMLAKLITKTYIKFGNELYRQKGGIPQGSCISTILCSLFMAHLDRHVLQSLRACPDNLLARLLDDFLFITPREADAESFLYSMLQRVAPYGIEISKEKSVVNFDLRSNALYDGVRRVPLDSEFAWCGFVIDQRLDVRIDYGRQENTHMSDTFSASTGRKPGKYFFARFYAFARSPMFRVAFNTKLNSLESVRLSIYQAFLSLAMRMYAYARARLSAARGAFLLNCHRLLVQLGARLITSKDGGLHFPAKIDRKHIVALGIAAFTRIWSRKGREGRLLVDRLEQRVLREVKLRRFELVKAIGQMNRTTEDAANTMIDKLRY